MVGPITRDAMAKAMKLGMYNVTCAETHAIQLGLQGKRAMLTVESPSFVSIQSHWAKL